jgi:hypothetical protein
MTPEQLRDWEGIVAPIRVRWERGRPLSNEHRAILAVDRIVRAAREYAAARVAMSPLGNPKTFADDYDGRVIRREAALVALLTAIGDVPATPASAESEGEASQ